MKLLSEIMYYFPQQFKMRRLFFVFSTISTTMIFLLILNSNYSRQEVVIKIHQKSKWFPKMYMHVLFRHHSVIVWLHGFRIFINATLNSPARVDLIGHKNHVSSPADPMLVTFLCQNGTCLCDCVMALFKKKL